MNTDRKSDEGAPGAPVINPNLALCPDCGATVSVRAEQCPACGAPFVQRAEPKRHGVFYYVFWTVASLFVIGIMLSALPLVIGGCGVAMNSYQRAVNQARLDAAAAAATNAVSTNSGGSSQ